MSTLSGADPEHGGRGRARENTPVLRPVNAGLSRYDRETAPT
jgi:hypothetical protein